ncbi:hypothetical protein HNO88_002206 [Novosphingobium chloroacetimidivorans]|uniref:VOC domain-containing protein n=1 Tax=Novosphingobium chloroacetimidivorans TaxID=1428314 RepID=A0A7W7K9W4_9SPHN|nr:VOC family protein [Novosphingobium chloroacetimidivorans]MBB4858880.1 hypothetical protein [Novosphingobium chloroacetimidivorans]
MTLSGFFQMGYVTHDLDRAIAATTPLLGSAKFATLDVELPLATPEGERTMQVRVATAWNGLLQVEFIQPVAGHVGTYTAVLPVDPDDATPRFHHVAVRRDDPQAMRREIEQLGLPIVFETGGNGITSAFIDARGRIGHYLEFVAASPDGWALMGWPAAA